MKKRLLSLLLVFVMVLGMLPVSTFAATELTWSGGTITLAPDTVVGTATMTALTLYKQGATSTFPTITGVTQDGTTIDITLAEDTDPSYPLQVGFSAGSMYVQHTNNSCTLKNGAGTMTVAVNVKAAAAPNAPVYGTGTFTVNFTVPMGEECAVNAPEAEGITFTGGAAYKDKAYSFKIAVNEGYDGTGMVVKVNGEAVTGENGTYTLENVSGDLTITVEGVVKKEVCAITVPDAEGVTFTGAESVYKGEGYTFTLAVDEAYDASNMVVSANGTVLTETGGKYTIQSVTEDAVITVTGVVKKTVYTVTLPEGEGYTVSGQSTSYAGEAYTFTVTVDDAIYKVADVVVKVNDEPVTLTDGKYTFATLDGDKTVTVENVVERQLFTVTKPEAEGITFTGGDTVREGKPYTFTVKADQAYDVSGMVVRVNGEELTGTDGSYTVPSVSSDLVISVEGITAKVIYNVTAPAAGKFTFTGGETVYEGEDYTFTVQANAGYTAAVKVNGEELTGTNGSYTVSAVSCDLVITVAVERAPITGTEVSVADGVIDITDKTVYTYLSDRYYARATNIQIGGVTVSEAYENGTTIYILLPYTAADDAKVSVTFGTSLNKCTMEGTAGSLTLTDGEGSLSMTLTGKYSSNRTGTATYTLIFFREEAPTQPPVCVNATESVEIWEGRSVTVELKDYFTGAQNFYLLEGEATTRINGNTYTATFPKAGEYTLVFGAENEFGRSQENLTVTVTAKGVPGGAYIGHTTSNGSLDSVTFTDGNGDPIEGLEVVYADKKITVILPKTYDLAGKVTATFVRTPNGDNFPRLSSSNAFNQGNGSWSDSFTNTLSNGAATRTVYLYNSAPKATSNSPEVFTITYKLKNELPALTGDAAAQATITAGENYSLDLAPVFADADGDAMTYKVSINGAAAVAADASYSYTTDVAGIYTLVFTANDGKDDSTDAYTVTLTVENTAQTDSMTVALPEGLAPVFYISTGFDANGAELHGEQVEAQEGETADGMTAYTVAYPVNVTMLSIRTEDWGGMAFSVEKDGTVTFRQMQFNVVDYDENPAESTNTVTYDGHTAAAGTQGWLLAADSTYTFAAVPKDATLAAVSETVTVEAGADIYTHKLMLGMSNPMIITVPTGGKAQLYKFNQYYSNTELDAKIVKDNGDGTTSYSFVADTKANGANYIYRVTMPGKITKAGWLAWGKQSLTVTYSDSDKSPDYRLDDYSGTGEASSGVAEDSVLLNINSRNHLNLSVGQSKVLKAYRVWEIIPVSYNNYIIPPDFTYTILSGDDVVSLSEKASVSAADGDWMTLTALKEGVAVIEVTYDAIKVEGGQYDGVYGASDPARAGLVVVQVGESDDTSVNFGIDSFASIGKAGSSNVSYNPNNAKAWDAEFDTLYFTGDSGELNLTPTASGAIAEVAVSHDKGVSWTVLNGEEGTYTAKIVSGNNILRVKTANGTAYQVVRGDKITVTLKEVDGKSDGDGTVEAGETVRVTLVGLHSPIPKMAGNYNPGFGGNDDGYSSQHLNYTCNGEAIYGAGMQYNFITAANYVDIVMPEDGSSVSLTDGYIGVGVIGLDNFVNGGDSHRNIPDNGCTTRGSKSTWHTRSMLPDITVTVGGSSAPNTAPIVRGDAVTEAEIYDDQKYAINPDTLFQDADGNTLTFTLSVNGGEEEPVGVDFKFVPQQAGVYTLTFTASDGKESVQHAITLTVTPRQTEEETDDKFGLEDAEIAGYATISFEDNGIRVTGETGLKFPVPLGTIIEPTKVPFKAGENIAQVTKRLLDHLEIGMKYSGTLESGFYLGAITNFEVDSTPYASMGEFDAGVGSGWMITQNDVFINQGASEFAVADGDVLCWKYTCQVGADIGDNYAQNMADAVEALIEAIGTVTLDSEPAITEARAAYDALNSKQKTLVENYAALTAAEAALAELKETADADQAAAAAVEVLIEAIGTVTPDSESAITEARAAYDALTAAQKAMVENYTALTDAETLLAALKAPGLDEMYQGAAETLKAQTPITGSIGGEWLVFGLSRALDVELTEAQKTAYETALKELIDAELNSAGQLNSRKPTENARVALALSAMGCDPAAYYGKNLLAPLEDTEWAAQQGNNSSAFALLAFRAAGYDAANTEALIDSLLANQLENGGWNIVSGGADADTTAMVVQALAPYYQSDDEIKAAVDKALVYLKSLMNAKGQLNNGVDDPSAETVSQMIVALCELGIDPMTWKTEDGVHLLQGLASFYVNGDKKGFAHLDGGRFNQMATEQAFYAMVAYKRLLDENASALYDMSDIRVTRYDITVTVSDNGTVTAEPMTAAAGETVTVTVTPDLGYAMGKLTVNGEEVAVTDGRATFVMPEADVVLKATFVKGNTPAQTVAQAMTELEVVSSDKDTCDAISDIKKAYNKLTDAEQQEIDEEYQAFLEKIARFEDDLEAQIDDAVEQLEDFLDDLDEDDYSKKAWKKIEALYEEALESVNNARFAEEVEQRLDDYLDELEKAAAGELEVTFRLIGDGKHNDGVRDHDEYVTWIKTTEYTLPDESTVYDLLIMALEEFDLSQKGAASGYVESIRAPEILGGYWIGEFDNGPNSGWMYTVNGDHPGIGLKDCELEDGDEVIWHYVDDYTLEERDDGSRYYERWLEADDVSPETYAKRSLDDIVTVEGNGEVEPQLKISHIGEDVTFTFTPAAGWVIKTVYVDGVSRGSVESYTCEELTLDTRIEVVFIKKTGDGAQLPAAEAQQPSVEETAVFTDVDAEDWFFEDVQFAVENGLFNGLDEHTFAPNATMTRAMLVTVLYRLAGQPAVTGGTAFADVEAGQWYTDAVIWATRNGIVNGLGNGKFGTNDNVTREQMAAILYRYAANCGYDADGRADLSGYADAAAIGGYAQDAMSWANAMGLINGRTATTLVPVGTATRAEVAAVFHRFVETIEK